MDYGVVSPGAFVHHPPLWSIPENGKTHIHLKLFLEADRAKKPLRLEPAFSVWSVGQRPPSRPPDEADGDLAGLSARRLCRLSARGLRGASDPSRGQPLAVVVAPLQVRHRPEIDRQRI